MVTCVTVFLATVNSAVMSIRIQLSIKSLVSVFMIINTETELLDHMVLLYYTFLVDF